MEATDVCAKCVPVRLKRRWQRFDDGRKAIRGICPRCGGYVKFLSQTDDNVALADGELDWVEADPENNPGQGRLF